MSTKKMIKYFLFGFFVVFCFLMLETVVYAVDEYGTADYITPELQREFGLLGGTTAGNIGAHNARDIVQSAQYSVQDAGGAVESHHVEIAEGDDGKRHVLIDGNDIGIIVPEGVDVNSIQIVSNDDGTYNVIIPNGENGVNVKVGTDNKVVAVNGVKVAAGSNVDINDANVVITDEDGNEIVMSTSDSDTITVEVNGREIQVIEGTEVTFDHSDAVIKNGENEVIIDDQGQATFKNGDKTLPVESIPDDASILLGTDDKIIIESGGSKITIDKDGNIKLFEGEKEIELSEDSEVSLNSDGSAKVKLGKMEITYDAEGNISGLTADGENINLPAGATVDIGEDNVVITSGGTELTYDKYGNVEKLMVNGQEIDIAMSIVHSDTSKVEFNEDGDVVIAIDGKNPVVISEDGDSGVAIIVNGTTEVIPSDAEVTQFKINNDGSVSVKYKQDDKDYLLTIDNSGASDIEDQTPPDGNDNDNGGGDQDNQQDATGGSNQSRGCGPIQWQVGGTVDLSQ